MIIVKRTKLSLGTRLFNGKDMLELEETTHFEQSY